MQNKESLKYLPRFLTKALIFLVLGLSLVQPAIAASPPNPGFAQINRDGFGDRQNSYSWSMAWFRGKLYVGTNRNFLCVEAAILDFYFPELNFYTTNPDPAVPCTADPADLNLQAEIWRYDPNTEEWDRVFQSPNDLPNPQAPGKFIARDIGFRDMVVFQEPGGQQALYVVGVTAREYTPGLPPPRILRSTDGITFTPVPQDPGTFLGDLGAVGFRSATSYQGRLYVTASAGLTGEGVILESDDPSQGNDHFRPISPSGLNVFELAVFNNFLYVGVANQDTGYAVLKTTATGTPPYNFQPIVTGGGGRGKFMLSVVSMHPFKGQLYVGSNGFAQFPISAELIRINPNDSWEVVVGNPRLTPQGFKFPISGLPDSFGNPWNIHFWRMQEHNGELYLGTNDASVWFRNIPGLDPFIKDEYGFDLYKTRDGKGWVQLTRNGFGDRFNFGLRTFASTLSGLFLGTVNYVTGTEVWQQRGSRQASRAATSRLQTPTQTDDVPETGPLQAISQDGAIILSWQHAPGAVQFRVFRAEHSLVDASQLPAVMLIPGLSGELTPPDGTGPQPSEDFLTVGPFSLIGTTADVSFRDDSVVQGRQYSCYVQAEDSTGQVFEPSNTVIMLIPKP